LLTSPISWSHHWVWFVPAVLVLLAQGRRRAAVVLALVPALAPEWWTPSTQAPYTYIREFHHHWWQTWLCLSYAVAGLAFLVMMARAQPDRSRANERRSGGQVTSRTWTAAIPRRRPPAISARTTDQGFVIRAAR